MGAAEGNRAAEFSGRGAPVPQSARADRCRAHRPVRHDEGPRRGGGVERAELELRRRSPRHNGQRHPPANRPGEDPCARAHRRQPRTGVARLVSAAKKGKGTRGHGDKEPRSGSPWRSAIYFLLTLAVAGGLVWGIKQLGDGARQGIGPRDRYTVRFLDIECEPPPGMSRVGFLAEVRFVSKFPETFQSLVPDLSAKLSAAFAAHPWVA